MINIHAGSRRRCPAADRKGVDTIYKPLRGTNALHELLLALDVSTIALVIVRIYYASFIRRSSKVARYRLRVFHLVRHSFL
jgi:hypothetical protein